MLKNAVSGTSEEAVKAAESVIVKGGALGAVVAGAFAAAAVHESVLMGPIQILAGGGGAGLFAWDGRVRQPGKGVTRPRGFVDEEVIPDAARVGAPAFVASLVAVLAHAGTLTLAQAMSPAIALAGKKTPRGSVLASVRDRGPRAMLDHARELVAAGGRLAGGVLTEEDLAAPEVKFRAATLDRGGPVAFTRVPWLDGAAPRAEGCRIHILAAADRAGAVAIAAFEDHSRGVAVPELGLVLPLVAQPVTRGVPRVRPGVGLDASAPIALLAFGERVDAAVGAGGRAGDEGGDGDDPERTLARFLKACEEGSRVVPSGHAVVGVLQGSRSATKLGA